MQIYDTIIRHRFGGVVCPNDPGFVIRFHMMRGFFLQNFPLNGCRTVRQLRETDGIYWFGWMRTCKI
jgi:hypothetical protein